MKAEEQVPRNALVWMILSLFALVAPHLQRIQRKFSSKCVPQLSTQLRGHQ